MIVSTQSIAHAPAVLALETSSERGTIALNWRGECLQSTLPVGGSAHSTALLPAIQQLLAHAGCRLRDLDVIAFGRGPGAFTGVRLACGVAQGLALGAELPVAPISSLAALAHAHQTLAKTLLCVVDARMNEVYSAAFQVTAVGCTLLSEPACTPPEALPVLPHSDYVLIGNAQAAYQARWDPTLPWAATAAWPEAAAIAALAADRSRWCDPAEAAPEYVRNRVAQTVAERLAQGGRA